MGALHFRLGLMLLLALGIASSAVPDGLVIRPRDYKGSLAEKAQEAVIIFTPGDENRSAKQDIILKIQVTGDSDRFAWVVPLPGKPETHKEDPAIFKELFDYVQYRNARPAKSDGAKSADAVGAVAAPKAGVEVISRQVVGHFEVTVVQEKLAGALNEWLKMEGYQELEGAEDVIGFYRRKNYFFTCIKVSAQAKAEAAGKGGFDSHPLRFSFETGGRDGIYFPMKLTGLQSDPFDVNLYVFYDKWINDRLSRFGYAHRGMKLTWRDYDSPQCEPNAGKSWSLPEQDPYLKDYARFIPTVKTLFQKLHPGQKYYLTNIQARNLKPADVRQWADDLWLFPYYTNPTFVPFDARTGGPAHEAWPDAR